MNLTPEEIPFLGKLSDNICLSGGARGADVLWGKYALEQGHQVVHWSFEGHNSYDKDNTYILTKEELEEADEYIKEVNLTLKRNINKRKTFIMNLFRRNWYQVKYADWVFAVGSLNENAVFYDSKDDDYDYHIYNIFTSREDRMGINGGTAWACQFYLDRYRREKGNPFYLLFFDQITQKTYIYRAELGMWMEVGNGIPSEAILKPKGIYAAVGSRDLNEHGKDFIHQLFNK